MFGIFDGIYSFTTSLATDVTTSATTSFSTSFSTSQFFAFVTDTTLYQNYISYGNYYMSVFIGGSNQTGTLSVNSLYVPSVTVGGYTYTRNTYRTAYDFGYMYIEQYDFTRSNTTSRTTSRTTSSTTTFTTLFDVDFYA